MSGALMSVLGSGRSPVLNPIPVSDLTSRVVDPADATAGITLVTDGTITTQGTLSTAGPNWFDPTTAGIGSNYWARLTVTAGSAPTSGTAGTWQQLNVNRTWSWTRTTIGTLTATVTIEIASDAAGANIVASVTGVPVEADVTT